MNIELMAKLKITSYTDKLILNLPDSVTEFDGMEYDTEANKDRYDLICTFVFALPQFEKAIQDIISKNLLAEKGYIYIFYPKKGNKQYKEHIDRDSVLTVVPDDGFVRNSNIKFVKMASFNDTFTAIGLRPVTKAAGKNKPSQCVDDYIERIPNVRERMANFPDVLAIYDKLTFGYQKDWARYLFSTKNEATVEKRTVEMLDILKAGYKSKDLFRQGEK